MSEISSVGLSSYLTVASAVFSIGVFGIYSGRNHIISLLMSLELILLSVNINLVSFSSFLEDLTGQIFIMFVLTIAAAEVSIGLAILVVFYRSKGTIELKDLSELKG